MKNVNRAVEWALEIAESLPEKYQQVAFAELLRHALKSTQGFVEDETEVPVKTGVPPSGETWEERLVSGLPDDYLIAKKGTRDQQAVWAVIILWREGDEATSESVPRTIKTKLGVKPESLSPTSNRLRRLTPKYLDRTRKGRAYAYAPTARALEIFKGLEE